jgi:hypothetical protein
MLVDSGDMGEDIRVLFYLEHTIQDASTDNTGKRREVSRQLQFIEIDEQGNVHAAGYAPFLDYRPLREEEQLVVGMAPGGEGLAPTREATTFRASQHDIPERHVVGMAPTREATTFLPSKHDIPERQVSDKFLNKILTAAPWLKGDLEEQARSYAITELVPRHLGEVRQRREEQIDKTSAAVNDRLTTEISYWDNRAAILKAQEAAGRTNARLNSQIARQRAEELLARLERRLSELEQERKLSPLPPVVVGGVLVIPQGLLNRLTGQSDIPNIEKFAHETARIERIAMEAVMQAERQLGYIPRDVSADKCGYDIESRIPGTGKLRFIEVKGRVKDSTTVTVTKNEILTALNKPDDFILAIVEVDGDATTTHYIARPFQREPDFGATSVNYDLEKLRNKGVVPV